jgi:hypothetical protein
MFSLLDQSILEIGELSPCQLDSCYLILNTYLADIGNPFRRIDIVLLLAVTLR